MKVSLIERSTMSGKELTKTAYIDSEFCQLKCDELKEEWASYKPIQCEGEEIPNDRVIVNDRVYKLDKTDIESALKQRALLKLSEKERALLNLG